MYSKDYALQSIPEIVAHSGFALLHFYSDIAYNLSGFNITYRYVKCITYYIHFKKNIVKFLVKIMSRV